MAHPTAVRLRHRLDDYPDLAAWIAVREALECAPRESLLDAATRVVRTGQGRLDVAHVVLPGCEPLRSEAAWTRIRAAAALLQAVPQ